MEDEDTHGGSEADGVQNYGADDDSPVALLQLETSNRDAS